MELNLKGKRCEICRILECLCGRKRKIRAVVTLGFPDGTAITFTGDWKMQVPDTGGPFTADISAFVDAKNNPVTDTDIPVWASSDTNLATVVPNDPAGTDPQGSVVTLGTGTGQAQITASFPAQKGGQPFVVTGSLEIVGGAAVSATMTFAGPGITTP